jgi:hypothetical protein
MRVLSTLLTSTLLALGAALGPGDALAQKPVIPFQPGEWKINLTMVLNNGKPVNSQMQVCAKKPEDAWNQKRPGQSCDPVQVTQVPGGARIRIHCKMASGPVVSESKVDMLTHFASDGQSYTENGTSESSTTMPGHPPMVMKIQLQGTGTRLGPCPANAQP